MQLFLSVLIFMMVQAVLFGVGVVAILATPFVDNAEKLMLPMIISTMLLSAPLAWLIAVKMRLNNPRILHLWKHMSYKKTKLIPDI